MEETVRGAVNHWIVRVFLCMIMAHGITIPRETEMSITWETGIV